MIAHVDNMLRHLFIDRIAGITSADQVGFQPPDQDWRNHVGTLSGTALNVYLVALAENRKLRSNERDREFRDGHAYDRRAPRRLDCHYLITAWSPVAPSALTEPSLDEHALLYETAAVLSNAEPLIPRRIYAPSPLPATFPAAIADVELPSVVLASDGLPQMSDFWSTVEWRWKPAVHLTVTLPLVYDQQIEGPMVTTRITEYRQTGRPETAQVWVQIGGHVRTGAPPQPIAGAFVQLETAANAALQATDTDTNGRFTFADLVPGAYVLRIRARGVGEVTRNIQVPSDGGYDQDI
ncbi:MAG TPA: Pvc16 family protein [Vicinamibacterales bacterium]